MFPNFGNIFSQTKLCHWRILRIALIADGVVVGWCVDVGRNVTFAVVVVFYVIEFVLMNQLSNPPHAARGAAVANTNYTMNI